MKRYPVVSRNLAEVGYDPLTKQLEVVFRNALKVLYTYKNVGVMKFVKLLTADSVGQYFQEAIRSRPKLHPYTRKKLP